MVKLPHLCGISNIQFTESRYTKSFGVMSICLQVAIFQNDLSVRNRPERRMTLKKHFVVSTMMQNVLLIIYLNTGCLKICHNPGNSTLLFRRFVLVFCFVLTRPIINATRIVLFKSGINWQVDQ